MADAGHRAGARLRDHAAFADSNARDHFALLVECGFHGSTESVTVALDVMARFLAESGCVDAGDLPAHWRRPDPPAQRLLHVTDAVTVLDGDAPRFTRPWRSGERVGDAGTLLGWTGGEPVRTPYADCFLIMPTLVHATRGATLVRLARETP